MWILYIVSSLYESGHWSSESLEGTWAVWIWFGITFFIGVAIYWFATHEDYGGWMNREAHEPSQARVFWSNHWAGIMTFMAFMLALAIRVQWFFVPSMNPAGGSDWDLTGGSDPWYMKRVIDYIVAENAHLIFDADRNYPVGGLNPRPPLFSWSLALGGILLSWLADMSLSEAVWWSVESQPAIWGALIVLPVAGMARRFHSPLAGIAAAWLIAFMPGHISHSTFGLADHDSFAMFFLTMGFYWWVRAMIDINQNRLFARTSWNPAYLIAGIRSMWANQRTVMLFATLAGISFATAGLAWKGFVYAPGIIFLAFSGVAILNLFRGRDTLPITSAMNQICLLYTSPSPRDATLSRMPSSA